MTDAIILAIGGNVLDFIQSEKNEEVLKRLFIQECRFNLSLLSLTKWKGSNKSFLKYIARNLKSDITSIMHIKYNNDFFHFTAAQIKKLIMYKDPEEDLVPDILLHLINKILILKVIADIPVEMTRYDKSNIDKRVSNLRESLNLIVQIIESKNKK